MRLDELVWPELAGRAERSILAVPLGSTEQHGPHLPLGTDSAVAVALTERLAAERPDVVVAPLLPYGSAGEHTAFPGTLSIGAAALELVIVELVRSAAAFAGAVLVSGHGGNAAPLAAAVATLQAEGRSVLAWSPRIAGGDAHAGRTETSLLLALAPEQVRLDAAEPGDVRPLGSVIGELRARGVAAVSPNGVLGDPTGASAEEGRRLLHTLAADLMAAVNAWHPGGSDAPPPLRAQPGRRAASGTGRAAPAAGAAPNPPNPPNPANPASAATGAAGQR